MGRLIDADALQNEYKKEHGKRLLLIDVAPTIEERKTGRWIRLTEDIAFDISGKHTWCVKYQCNQCGFIHTIIADFGHYDYCPQCGAKMEVEYENNKR